MPKFSNSLREIATALEGGVIKGKCLLIVQLDDDGELLSADSDLSVIEATTMAAEWVEALAEKVRRLGRLPASRPRCRGDAR